MNIEYSAVLVAGVPFASVVKQEKVSEVVVRYNENTGEKYEIPVKGSRVVVGRHEIEEGVPYSGVDEYLKSFGLTIFRTGYEPDDIIGESICGAVGGDSTTLCDINKVKGAIDRCERGLVGIGIKDGNPQVYLMLTADY